MKYFWIFLIFGSSSATIFHDSQHGSIVEQESITETSALSSDIDFKMNWTVDFKKELVTFHISVNSTGWIGFGISNSGGMEGADLIIGGIDDKTGQPYFQDRFATGQDLPAIDILQDWTLISANQSDGITSLSFQRKFSTCDAETDIDILYVRQSLIWAVGESDEIKYHGAKPKNRGVSHKSILTKDEDLYTPELAKYNNITLMTDVTMPNEVTSFACTVHKYMEDTPIDAQLIAFGPNLGRNMDASHFTHHQTLFVCDVKHPKIIKKFESYLGKEGVECSPENEKGRLFTLERFCYFLFNSASFSVKMPKDVGIPLDPAMRKPRPGVQRYFILETHLHNPEKIDGVKFATGCELFYSKKPLPITGGIFTIKASELWTFTLPPNSTDVKVTSHCSPQCLGQMGVENITIYNVQPHAHHPATIRIRHLRNGVELPWIANDRTFGHKFDYNREIPHRNISKGDQLIIECKFDTHWAKGRVVLGGGGGEEEMCAANIYYFPKTKMIGCGSLLDPERITRTLGIKNMSFPMPPENMSSKSEPIEEEPLVTDDSGTQFSYSEYVNKHVDWTPERISEMKAELSTAPQIVECTFEDEPHTLYTGYPPGLKEFEACKS